MTSKKAVGRPLSEQPDGTPPFSLAVRALRTAKGMTQDELARAARTSQRQINRIEHGQEPGAMLALAIALALGADLEDMLTG